MKFKNKNEYVDAIQLTRDSWDEVCNFIGTNLKCDYYADEVRIDIPTVDGIISLTEHDYVVKFNGDFFVIPPSLFDSLFICIEFELMRCENHE